MITDELVRELRQLMSGLKPPTHGDIIRTAAADRLVALQRVADDLTGCQHPRDSWVVANGRTPSVAMFGAIPGARLVICERCGAATRDDGKTWRSPVLVDALRALEE